MVAATKNQDRRVSPSAGVRAEGSCGIRQVKTVVGNLTKHFQLQSAGPVKLSSQIKCVKDCGKNIEFHVHKIVNQETTSSK